MPKTKKAEPAKAATKTELVIEFFTKNPQGSRGDAQRYSGATSSHVLWLYQHGRLPEGTGHAHSGGTTKGDDIAAWFASNPNGSRAECAAAVGCTVQRVGEIIRAGKAPGTAGVPKSKLTATKVAPKVAKKAAAATATPKPKAKKPMSDKDKKAFAAKMADARAVKRAAKAAETAEDRMRREAADAAGLGDD